MLREARSIAVIVLVAALVGVLMMCSCAVIFSHPLAAVGF